MGGKERTRSGKENKGFKDNIGHMWRVIEYDGDIMYNNDKHFDQLLQKSGKMTQIRDLNCHSCSHNMSTLKQVYNKILLKYQKSSTKCQQ